MYHYCVPHNSSIEWFLGTHLAFLMFYIYYKIYTSINTQTDDENDDKINDDTNDKINDENKDEIKDKNKDKINDGIDYKNSQDLPKFEKYLKSLGKDLFGELVEFDFESDFRGSRHNYDDDVINRSNVTYLHKYFISMLISNYRIRIIDYELPSKFIYKVESEITDINQLKIFIKNTVSLASVDDVNDMANGMSNLFGSFLPQIVNTSYTDNSNKLTIQEVHKNDQNLSELEKEMGLIEELTELEKEMKF